MAPVIVDLSDLVIYRNMPLPVPVTTEEKTATQMDDVTVSMLGKKN